MIYLLNKTCPQCGHTLPAVSLPRMLLRIAIALPVAVVGVLTVFLLATVLLKYVMFPAFAFIARL